MYNNNITNTFDKSKLKTGTYMKKIIGKRFEEERALYGEEGLELSNCAFEGALDGESALKESKNIIVKDSRFLLRYPLWHVTDAKLINCQMTATCRAALWYDEGVTIENCNLGGIKALRECKDVTIKNTQMESSEFGWFCRDVQIENSKLISEYPFLHTENLTLDGFELNGKYSFQYLKNATIKNSVLNTKDAFWHSENVTVIDSVIKGEYLAWYSKGLKLIRCKIIGTQPLCYAKDLVLEDCIMENADLSFELSSVNATINGKVDSIKNVLLGQIVCDGVGEIIADDPKCKGIIKVR